MGRGARMRTTTMCSVCFWIAGCASLRLRGRVNAYLKFRRYPHTHACFCSVETMFFSVLNAHRGLLRRRPYAQKREGGGNDRDFALVYEPTDIYATSSACTVTFNNCCCRVAEKDPIFVFSHTCRHGAAMIVLASARGINRGRFIRFNRHRNRKIVTIVLRFIHSVCYRLYCILARSPAEGEGGGGHSVLSCMAAVV